MINNIPVQCLVDRSWNPLTKTWDGNLVAGTLVGISTQTAEDHSGRIISVGIVVLGSGSFHSVPIEFMFAI